MKNYELLDHTADIRIKVTGDSLKELFINAAAAVFDIIAQEKEKKAKAKPKKISVNFKAPTREDLFVNWLNELLSLSQAKGLIFYDFKVKELTDQSINAEVTGSDYSNYDFDTEIKAATYHELEIKQVDSIWQAKIILDV
jgi:SHS2 domain-containing protein